MYIGIVLLIASVIPSLIVGKETPLPAITKSDFITNSDPSQSRNIFIQTWYALKRMPNEILRILLVFFFSNAAYTPFLFYFTDYMGTVLHGDGSAAPGTHPRELYDEGVRYGALALAINLSK